MAVFSNDWSAPRLFYNTELKLEYCEEEVSLSDYVDPDPDLETLGDELYAEKILLSCRVPGLQSALVPASFHDWLYYMKLGATLQSGKKYKPIINTLQTFHDYHHESINPFTPQELESMQPAGKAFYANYKTYYNERQRSRQSGISNFESVTGQNTNLQNSLPNIYSFLRLLANESLTENDFFEFKPIFDYVKYFLKNIPDLEKIIYTDVLKKYPLETLVSLYGRIGHEPAGVLENSKIIEKIISLNFDKVDADGLFSDYYKEYTANISNVEILQFGLDKQSNKIRALERIMSNLIFSPDSTKMLNKVDQYKKYFPFYAELEFTTNLYTSVGDSAKQLFLTKFLSEAVLSRFTIPPEAEKIYVGAAQMQGWSDEWTPKIQEAGMHHAEHNAGTSYTRIATQVDKVVSFSETTTFTDISGKQVDQKAGSISEHRTPSLKLDTMLKLWLKPQSSYFLKTIPDQIEGIHVKPQQIATESQFESNDLRNYTTYFRNDFSEPININSDDNIIFKKLFGSAFVTKILDLYKKHKRSFTDIINGVPAYTEDLFYRIEKIRRDPSTGEEMVVQNILIPNTSELDVVKYVDTQLKYATYATYKYNIYAHKIIFGNKYRYYWLDQNTGDPLLAGVRGNPASKGPNFQNEQTVEDIVELVEKYSDGITMKEKLSGNSASSGNAGQGEQQMIEGDLGGGFMDDEDKLQTSGQVQTGGQTAVEYTDMFATFRVKVMPSIILAQDKIFSTPPITILDKPPVTPDINIVPYRAVNNRIKILLTGASDRYRMEPVIILDSDSVDYSRIASAQLSTDGKIEFGSDDAVTNFQIFRIEKKPTEYSDFELYDQISEQVYEEVILPNTKYYYTFRAIDEHGHISNPTPVYEVELIDEKGAVKPVIRLVDMEPKKNKSNIKDCQKYIFIKPNLQQLYFSDNPEVDTIFSNDENKKRYKMRLTSKGSGKKIDINFSFKKKIETD